MDKRVMSELEYIVQAYGYTRIDWERIRRCTREEKETLIPWVKELIAWEKKYRLEGLLIGGMDPGSGKPAGKAHGRQVLRLRQPAGTPQRNLL